MSTSGAVSISPDLLERMPRFMQETRDPIAIKDFTYYCHQGNLWNSKYRTSKKIMPFYHSPGNKFVKQHDYLKQRESDEKEFREAMRKMMIMETRAKSHSLLKTRITQRNQLAEASGLKVDNPSPGSFTSHFPATETDPMRKTFQMKLIRGRHMIDQNKWNYFLDANKKHTNLLANSFAMQKEDEYIERMQRKLQEDALINSLRERAFEEKRRELREKLAYRHNATSELVEKSHLSKSSKDATPSAGMNRSVYLSSERNGSPHKSQWAYTPKYNRDEQFSESMSPVKGNASMLSSFGNNTSAQELPGFSPKVSLPRNLTFRSRFSHKDASAEASPSKAEYIENLSKPREKMIQPKNAFDRPEFKGMWSRQLDNKTAEAENVFVRDLTNKSTVLNSVLASTKAFQKPSVRRGGSVSSSMGFSQQATFNEQIREDTRESEEKTETKKSERNSVKAQLSSPKELLERDMVLKDIDRFDYRISMSSRAKGYPKIALEAAIKLRDTEGFKQYLKEKHVE